LTAAQTPNPSFCTLSVSHCQRNGTVLKLTLAALLLALTLQRLKRLVLDDNALVGVYGEQFAGLAQLAELSLKRNNIRSPRGLSGLTAAVRQLRHHFGRFLAYFSAPLRPTRTV